MLTHRGWIGGLGGAAAITIGVVIAALIAAGLTAFHGGGSHVNIPATPRTLSLGGQSGAGAPVSYTSAAQQSTQKTSVRRGTTHRRTSALTGHSGPLRERRGATQTPTGRIPGSPGGGGGSRDSSSPTPGTPSPSAPSLGSGGGGNGGGGGSTTQPPASLGGAVKNTTQQLGDTVDNTTQTLGNTVGAVSPVLGDTVKQTGPALGDTVKGTGDLVGGTLDGLLGGHH